nr:AbiH family protein [Gilliamella apicola]
MSEVEMNRLILIGNGFDLAHGLKTSFNDFIDYYVSEFLNLYNDYEDNKLSENIFIKKGLISYDFIKSVQIAIQNLRNLFAHLQQNTDEIKTFDELFDKEFHDRLDNNLSFIDNIKHPTDQINDHYPSDENKKAEDNVAKILELIKSSKSSNNVLSDLYYISSSVYNYYTLNQIDNKPCLKQCDESLLFTKNKLFEKIFYNYNFNKNWGGIEHEFYQTLLDVEEFYREEKILDKIDKLNKEFENIIDCFIYYMTSVVSKQETKILSKIAKHLMQPVNDDELSTQFRDRIGQQPIVIKEHMFLSFNYTNTIEKYIAQSSVNVEEKHVQIHGRLEDSASKIIFGYGDELDSSYKELEDKNDNRYLKYLKSLHYLDTDNYQKLLDFLEQNKYQVYIWGHSCATSDRVLLQTIFEHENCVSIKPFYYQDEKGNDNFEDLYKNISRHFTDKNKLRDLVVNKKYCEPLT